MKTHRLILSCIVALVLVSAAVIAVKFFSSGTEEPVAQVIAGSQSGAIETKKGQTLPPQAEGSRSLAGALPSNQLTDTMRRRKFIPAG